MSSLMPPVAAPDLAVPRLGQAPRPLAPPPAPGDASAVPASAHDSARRAAQPLALPGFFVSACRWRPLPGDVRAAAVSALVMLPQAIAFAVLAGLPPEMGVYGAVLPVIVASLCGPSRQLLTGPNTAVAVMLGAALLPLAVPGSLAYLGFAAALTAMVGLVQIVAAAAGVGRVLALLPRFVFTGLNMGIGLVMLCCQVAPAMGLLHARDMPSWLIPGVFATRIDEANPWAIVVAASSLAAGLAFTRWRRAWMPPLVAAMLAGAVAGFALDLMLGSDGSGLERVGHLHLQWLAWSWPAFDTDEVYVLKQLALSAVAIAVVGALQSVIILRSIGEGDTAGPKGCRRELMAQGASNLVASVSGAFAGSGSFNRTAAHIDAGARTRAAAVLSSLLLLVMAWITAPALAHVAAPAIAGTIALVGWSMIKSGIASARKDRGFARWAALAVGAAVPILGIEAALLAATLLGFVHLLVVQGEPCKQPGRRPA